MTINVQIKPPPTSKIEDKCITRALSILYSTVQNAHHLCTPNHVDWQVTIYVQLKHPPTQQDRIKTWSRLHLPGCKRGNPALYLQKISKSSRARKFWGILHMNDDWPVGESIHKAACLALSLLRSHRFLTLSTLPLLPLQRGTSVGYILGCRATVSRSSFSCRCKWSGTVS